MSETCQVYDAITLEVCTAPAVIRWDAVCVHEHISPVFVCQVHKGQMELQILDGGEALCTICAFMTEPSHDCRVKPLPQVVL